MISARTTPSLAPDAQAWSLLIVLPLALPMFGLEPIHGGAVLHPDGGVSIIAGDSGAGKSTILGELLLRDCRLVADDATAIDAQGRCWCGPPFRRVAKARADLLAGRLDGKEIEYAPPHAAGAVEVSRTVLLEPGGEAPLTLNPLGGSSAFSALLGHARAPQILPDVRRDLQFQVIAGLAAKPVLRLTYDKTRHPPTDVADLLLSELASGVGG